MGIVFAFSMFCSGLCSGEAPAADVGHGIKKGDKLQTLSNLHPDTSRHLLYTLNYQLPAMIPVCANVTVTSLASRKMSFLYEGQEYDIQYDSFTKEAGVSFQKVLQT